MLPLLAITVAGVKPKRISTDADPVIAVGNSKGLLRAATWPAIAAVAIQLSNSAIAQMAARKRNVIAQAPAADPINLLGKILPTNATYSRNPPNYVPSVACPFTALLPRELSSNPWCQRLLTIISAPASHHAQRANGMDRHRPQSQILILRSKKWL